MTPGLIIAAPASGSGKTVFTLACLRALKNLPVVSAKVGPDYIDPAFHAAASGRPCRNLDPWAMRPDTLAAVIGSLGEGTAADRPARLILCEGVMGLFDGADTGEAPGAASGSTADLAALTGWPVLLVVDLKGQAASAAALIDGFCRHRPDIAIAGLVFNRVGGPAHRRMVEAAVAATCPGLPILGWLPRHPALALPERHLGLVPAGETGELDARLEEAARLVAQHVDLERLTALARPASLAASPGRPQPLPPLGQRIAVARDEAFVFAYPTVLEGWRQAGAEILPFAPLADQPPSADADAVFLPGGYPELQAGRLAGAARFLGGLRRLAAAGTWVYGECGGFMVLGERLEDADGHNHAMAGLLPLSTSFARRRLHLGYRQLRLAAATPLGTAGTAFRGHEFHYASITGQGPGQALFDATDAAGRDLGPLGRAAGTVIGSFIHLIDRSDPFD